VLGIYRYIQSNITKFLWRGNRAVFRHAILVCDTCTPMASIAIRFRVDFNAAGSIGPGKIALLEEIARSGSLSQAARDLRMSYRRAWELIDSLNGMFSRTVASSTTGGRGGGGMRLTPFGESVIKSYRKLERDVEKQAALRLESLAQEVATNTQKKTPLPRRAVSRTRRLSERVQTRNKRVPTG
jgi:molybdate transport system regulatory protein